LVNVIGDGYRTNTFVLSPKKIFKEREAGSKHWLIEPVLSSALLQAAPNPIHQYHILTTIIPILIHQRPQINNSNPHPQPSQITD
jgi:hypothetical protein